MGLVVGSVVGPNSYSETVRGPAISLLGSCNSWEVSFPHK